MHKLLAKATGALRVMVVDELGEAKAADAGVTVTITDSGGTQVGAADRTATLVTGQTGVYQVEAKPADTAALDTFTATWKATVDGDLQTYVTDFEVVGRHLITLAELRAHDSRLTAADFPAWELARNRDVVEDTLEEAMGVAWRPKARRVTLDGEGASTLLVPDLLVRKVRSATVDGTAFTQAELDELELEEWGALTRPDGKVWAKDNQNVKLLYEYGFDGPIEPVHRAALQLGAAYAVELAVPSRTTSQSTEVGVFRLTIAGRDGRTGIPEVDAVIEQFSDRLPVKG